MAKEYQSQSDIYCSAFIMCEVFVGGEAEADLCEVV